MKQINQKWNTQKLLISVMVLILTIPAVSFAAFSSPQATSNSITLTWTAPGDDGNQGQASQYDLRYSLNPITNNNWNQATPVQNPPSPQPAGSAESFTVTNLDPGTTYYFAIKVADEVPNWSGLSNVVSRTTLPESTPPGMIADLVSTSQTANSVTISWTAPGDDGTTGTATAYDIRYSTSPITAANWDAAIQITDEPTPSAPGSTESYTISGLQESTVYYVAIKTSDEVPNWSGLSNILSIATTGDQTPPSAIDDLQASTGSEQGQLTVSWTAPGDDGYIGKATGYLMRYSTEEINDNNWLAPITDSSNFVVNPLTPSESGAAENFTIENLAPGVAYYVAIKAVDEKGNTSSLSNVAYGISMFDLSLDTDDDILAGLPQDYVLNQNYPNPFNPETEIAFSLPENANVSLEIFNSLGQKVNSLTNNQFPAGEHSLSWNGTDDNGNQLASGIYFYKLTANEFSQSKKMVMLK